MSARQQLIAGSFARLSVLLPWQCRAFHRAEVQMAAKKLLFRASLPALMSHRSSRWQGAIARRQRSAMTTAHFEVRAMRDARYTPFLAPRHLRHTARVTAHYFSRWISESLMTLKVRRLSAQASREIRCSPTQSYIAERLIFISGSQHFELAYATLLRRRHFIESSHAYRLRRPDAALTMPISRNAHAQLRWLASVLPAPGVGDAALPRRKEVIETPREYFAPPDDRAAVPRDRACRRRRRWRQLGD